MLLNEDGANTAPDRGVAALRAVVHALSRPKGAKGSAKGSGHGVVEAGAAGAGAAGAAPPFDASG